MRDVKRSKEQMSAELTELRSRMADLEARETERRQSQMAFLENQARLAGILEIATDAIICIDEDQRIILFNKGAENIFGYSRAEAIGQSLDLLLPKRFAHSHRDLVREFSKSGATARLMGERQEIYGRRKDGQEFPAEASIAKLEADSARVLTVVLRDITDRKQAELEREHLIVSLKSLSEAAQAISAELALEQVLQKIADAARSLIKARYAALGLHDGQGHLSQFVTSGLSPSQQAKIKPLPRGRGLLGLLLHQGKSVLISGVTDHPIAVGFPPHHPVMQNLLGVPIHAKEKLIGALYLADKEDGSEFSETDRQLIEMLALHAAVAIENARLYEQTELLAVLEERERFAQDLHDGIIQSIYAVGLSMDGVKSSVLATDPFIGRQLDLCLQSLAKVIDDIRRYIFDLRPQALQQKGLKARLESLVQELKVRLRLPIEAEINAGVDDCLNEWQANHVFHICHEALSNAVRHARADHIAVGLTLESDTVTLRVEDDGTGFNPPPEIKPGHRGLANIQARAAQLGAQLSIHSAPDQGTHITLNLPCSRPLD